MIRIGGQEAGLREAREGIGESILSRFPMSRPSRPRLETMLFGSCCVLSMYQHGTPTKGFKKSVSFRRMIDRVTQVKPTDGGMLLGADY